MWYIKYHIVKHFKLLTSKKNTSTQANKQKHNNPLWLWENNQFQGEKSKVEKGEKSKGEKRKVAAKGEELVAGPLKAPGEEDEPEDNMEVIVFSSVNCCCLPTFMSHLIF